MSETAEFFVMQIVFLAVVLSLHTYLGLHIIRRTIIFCDLALDQLAALGAIMGLGLGIQFGGVGSYLIAFVMVVVGALLLAVIKPRGSGVPREAVIGIIYAMALVLSLLLADKIPGGDTYVAKTLSGSMLWLNWTVIVVTIVSYAVLLVFHFLLRHKFIAITEGCAGLRNERLWDFLFFTTQGIITVLVVPVAGVLLAYAFLMIPAAVALLFTRRWAAGLILGWGVGFVACVLGLFGSYRFDFPYGPSLVVALGAFFIAALALKGARAKACVA